MKLLLVAEGQHELNPGGESSALMEIVRQLLPFAAEIDRKLLTDRVVQQTSIRGKKGAHQKTLMLWVRWAELAGYDAIIAVIDEDGYTDRRKAVADLQGATFSSMPRALGLAIRAFDAWMLADERAVSAALGRTIQRRKAPERIKDQKTEFEALRNSSPVPISPRGAYLEVAKQLDLTELAKRCPKGFAPFRRNVEQLSSKP